MIPGRDAVVINADDFGVSVPVNEAIDDCFRRGWITSATVMANMPGFDDACQRIRAGGLDGRIGQHLVMSDGPALTQAIRRWPRLCTPEGRLAGVPGSIARLGRDEARDLEAELRAQIEALRARGVVATHFDSHGHVHTQWPVATLVMRLARHFGVPAVRLTRNCGSGIPLVKRVYKGAFNARLARAGLAKTRWFGSAADADTLRGARGAVEIMVHPVRGAHGAVVDLTPQAPPLDGLAARWGATHRLASYGELAAAGRTP